MSLVYCKVPGCGELLFARLRPQLGDYILTSTLVCAGGVMGWVVFWGVGGGEGRGC